jgi:hypothetical protein
MQKKSTFRTANPSQPSVCQAEYLAREHSHQTKQQMKKQHPERQAKE